MAANPVDTVRNLIEAINKGEIETALSFYEPGAAFVVQPGKIVPEKTRFARPLRDSYH